MQKRDLSLKGFLSALFIICCFSATAQSVLRAVVKGAKTGLGVPDVVVGIKDSPLGALSDTAGVVAIPGLVAGKYTVFFSVIGYEKKVVSIYVPDTAAVVVLLEQDENTLKEVHISSTRNDNRLEDAPMKVEVVDKEEMQEEQAARPANVTGMLGDIGGIKVQQTSLVNGNENIRIQGLDGRYTQVLRDGMPLYDGLSGGFGILQIQPLDLKQIELIKGSASTLYGGGAIGGLINFISKTPSTTQQGEVILNQTSLNETSFTAFTARRYGKWGYTLFTGYTHAAAADVNNDGFSDVPQLDNYNIHPRLFFYPDDKTTLAVGYSATAEKRTGGDMNVIAGNSDSLHQYYEADKTQRLTGDLAAERRFDNGMKASVKASESSFYETIRTNTHYFDGKQVNYFGEASVLVTKERYNWTVGMNVTGNNFTKRRSDPTPLGNFSNSTPGIFGQATIQLPLKTTVQAGLRGDVPDRYGTFVLPAIAVIHHINDAFAARAGFGMGYKTPNALDQQIIEYNIEQLQPIGDSVQAEVSYGYNLEMNYKLQWDREKKFFVNASAFLTEINSPIVATQLYNDAVYFSNAAKPVMTRGFDVYLKLQLGELEVYSGYTYTDAERKYLAANQFMPLTPMHHLAFTAAYEIEGKWRFGVESDYTGSQYRDVASKTPGYTTFAALIEKDFGRRFAIMLNVENLFDYRQSRYEALYNGTVTRPEFKPVWAPVDGRVISLSLRMRI